MQDDLELIQRYARDGSDEAFTELVNRHCNLVWASAYRVLGDADLARDAAQMAFADLARKASHLPSGVIPAGWLYRAACLAASKLLRTQARRALREHEAMNLQELSHDDEPQDDRLAELLPLLDAALADLGERDRDAVTLRYLCGRSFVQVGAAIGTSDDTAQRRVSRAVEKLRIWFRRRGLLVSGEVVSAALTTAGAQAAPAGLSASLAVGALATAAATPFIPTLYSILKSNLIVTMKSNIITALVIGAPLAIVLALQHQSLHQLEMENNGLRTQIESKTAAVAARSAPASTPATATPEELAQAKAEHAELLRLRGEYGMLMRKSSELAAAANKVKAAEQETVAANELDRNVVDYMKNIGLLCRLYSNDNHDLMPTNFAQIAEPMKDLHYEISPDRFEFVQYGRPASLTVPGEILMREKVARVFPDGRKKRAYLLVDGSVQDVSPDADGSFAEVEKSFGLATMGPITPVPPGQSSEASR
jgi:RNA polymerase sigma factor (sigma-70 family)